jgi:hypothetical protein
MKYQKLLITLAFAVALGAEARAANLTILQSANFSDFTSGARNLSFNLLDTAFGSSVSVNDIVSISITGLIDKSEGGWVVTGNDPEFANDVTVEQTTKGWFTSTKSIGFSGTSTSPNLLSQYAQTFSLLPNGTLSGDFGSATTGSLGGSLNSGVFSEFLGAGTFNIVLRGFQSFLAEGDGIDTSNYNPSPKLSGNVTVTYEIVPEPSAASLLIFGLGGLVAIRCVRRKS